MKIDNFWGVNSNFSSNTSKKVKKASQLGKAFVDFLDEQVKNVDKLQQDAKQAEIDFALGKIDVHEVMLKADRAALAITAANSFVNKSIEAFKELLRMQI